MMASFREYVLHLIAVALVCAVIFRFSRGCGAVKLMIRLLCSIFLAYSIVQPVRQLDLRGFGNFTEDFREKAEVAVQWGENAYEDAWSESIRQGTEAYILEKAKAMNVDLVVEVELSDDDIPVPAAVSLTGRIAPYAKTVLCDMISQDLNIPKEKQTWISL